MIATQPNLQCSRPFRGLTSSVPDRYVVSHAACYVVSPFVVLFVTWSHPSYSCLLRGLTLRSPVRYVVSPFRVLFVTWSPVDDVALSQDLGPCSGRYVGIDRYEVSFQPRGHVTGSGTLH